MSDFSDLVTVLRLQVEPMKRKGLSALPCVQAADAIETLEAAKERAEARTKEWMQVAQENHGLLARICAAFGEPDVETAIQYAERAEARIVELEALGREVLMTLGVPANWTTQYGLYSRFAATLSHSGEVPPQDAPGVTLSCSRCGRKQLLPYVGEERVSIVEAEGWSAPPLLCPDCFAADPQGSAPAPQEER